jgi:hypothetical protein
MFMHTPMSDTTTRYDFEQVNLDRVVLKRRSEI